jgi:hypothetical protein
MSSVLDEGQDPGEIELLEGEEMEDGEMDHGEIPEGMKYEEGMEYDMEDSDEMGQEGGDIIDEEGHEGEEMEGDEEYSDEDELRTHFFFSIKQPKFRPYAPRV